MCIRDRRDYNNALLYDKKTLNLTEELKYDNASALNNAAWAYFNVKDYGHAYPLAKQCLEKLGETKGDSSFALNTIGCIIRDEPDSILTKYGIDASRKYELA